MSEFIAITNAALGDTVQNAPEMRLEITDDGDFLSTLTTDTNDVTVNGIQFRSYTMKITPPSDPEVEDPQATIEIGNAVDSGALLGLVNSISDLNSIRVRILIYPRADPSNVEFESIMDVLSAKIDGSKISFLVGYKRILDAPFMRMTFSKPYTPGLF